jgi:hypothetical protein
LQETSDVAAPFIVDLDGSVRVSGLVTFDKEVKDVYQLSVYARDATDRSKTLTLNVTILDVNENPELNQTDYYVSEDHTGWFGFVTAQDIDSQRMEFMFSKWSNGKKFFAMNKMGRLKVKNPLDYELQRGSPYTLYVTVTDTPLVGTGPPLSDTKAFNVYVTDVNDAPQFGSEPVFTVFENLPVSSEVGSVVVSDQDRTSLGGLDVLTLTVSGEDATFFDVKSTQLMPAGTSFGIGLLKELDFETKAVMRITLTASDGTANTR